jgi:UDPglucose 6-dehydrogenase
MKTLVIGTGYVGLVSGTCFAELGADVTCVDIDKKKIENLKKGIIPIFENGLEALVKKNYKARRLKFSSDIAKELKTADIIFIAVGTPAGKDGSADLTYIFTAAKTIAKSAKNGVVIVTKSTVPVGTNDKIKQVIQKTNPKLKFDMASNPEFLREGAAVKDFMSPDRVVIGTNSKAAFDRVAKLYRPIKGVKILNPDIRTAEMIKYTANAFLAMKVAYINEMSDICEQVGADIEKVAEGIGIDSRIGSKFLKVGPGFGGSCFPKDTLALQKIARSAGAPTKIIESVIKSNEVRKVNMAKKIIKAGGGSVKGKNIGILGVAFKANTDDIRDSSALVIIEELLKAGAKVFAYDPEGTKNAKNYFVNLSSRPLASGSKSYPQASFQRKLESSLTFCASKEEVIKNCNIVSIITEWSEFAKLNLASLKGKTLIDLRNLYSPSAMKGIKYISLGRK